MKDVKITVMRVARYDDLIALYERPLIHACDMKEGQVFLSRGGEIPEGFCESAWGVMESFVKTLAQGGGYFYDDWMQDPYTAMISCNDGFRPVSFLLKAEE